MLTAAEGEHPSRASQQLSSAWGGGAEGAVSLREDADEVCLRCGTRCCSQHGRDRVSVRYQKRRKAGWGQTLTALGRSKVQMSTAC